MNDRVISGTRIDGYPVVFFRSTRGGKPRMMARLPDLPGCMADGETQDDALSALREAFDVYREVADEDGFELPPPFSVFSRSIATDGSGAQSSDLAFGFFTLVDVQGIVDVEVTPPMLVPA